MTNPAVSVIIVTRDGSRVVGAAARSVKEQSFSAWELLVVDDSRGDETERVVASLAYDDSRIRYFKLADPVFVPAAANFALARAKGKYVAILDDDDRWSSKDKLARQVRFLEHHPDYVACGTGFYIVGEDGSEKGRVLKPESDAAIRRAALLANPVAHSTLLARRDTLDAVGRYDETLLQSSDWDVVLKLGEAGKLYNIPECLVSYTLWERNTSLIRQKEVVEAAYRILKRHRGHYPGFYRAWLLTLGYQVYTVLPFPARRMLNPLLSRVKKAVFSNRLVR